MVHWCESKWRFDSFKSCMLHINRVRTVLFIQCRRALPSNSRASTNNNESRECSNYNMPNNQSWKIHLLSFDLNLKKSNSLTPLASLLIYYYSHIPLKDTIKSVIILWVWTLLDILCQVSFSRDDLITRVSSVKNISVIASKGQSESLKVQSVVIWSIVGRV